MRRPLLVVLALAALGATTALAAPGTTLASRAEQAASRGAGQGGSDYPWAKRVAAAKRFAAERQGDVAFAVVDEEGRMRGFHPDERFDSASVIKVMLMLAYLRQGDVRDRPLTDAEKQLLAPMIKRSANEPASAIYQRVGAGALNEIADDADMKNFSTNPAWGLSQITARDQSLFMFEIERLIPDRHRTYAMHLLASIIPAQRWGIPPAVPNGWKVHFKGGFIPNDAGEWKIHQVALLRRGDHRLALAVLTQGNPSDAYGHDTVRGVAHRVLHGYE
jgi:hypothetical protein